MAKRKKYGDSDAPDDEGDEVFTDDLTGEQFDAAGDKLPSPPTGDVAAQQAGGPPTNPSRPSQEASPDAGRAPATDPSGKRAVDQRRADIGKGKNTYRVSLFGQPTTVVKADDEVRAVQEYFAHNGIISSDKSPTVVELEDDGVTAKEPPPAPKKKGHS
jgi:hypothetical protein